MNDVYCRTLFLWNYTEEFMMNIKRRGMNIDVSYNEMNFFERILRRILIKSRLPIFSFWIGAWKNSLDDWDTVILEASFITPPIVKYINEKNSNIRVIVWYWNPVSKNVSIDKFSKLNCEIWSFDERDCKNYNIKHNTQYYFSDIKLPPPKRKVDTIFIGADKGRISNLAKLDLKLKERGVSTYFHIAAPKRNRKVEFSKLYQEEICYSKILEHISSCKAIIDYMADGQAGLTLRPLEAMFFKRKLITNDVNIENRDFYNKNNIFIVGKDNMEDIKEFLDSPYEDIDSNVVASYDFDRWLQRFSI